MPTDGYRDKITQMRYAVRAPLIITQPLACASLQIECLKNLKTNSKPIRKLYTTLLKRENDIAFMA
jgi:hypothetical protein